MDQTRLSTKHEAFAALCAKGVAAGAAYSEVFPKASKATAETEGPALLRKPQVKVRVAQLQDQIEQKFTMDRVEWLESLARIARKAEAAEDFSAARSSLREIGLAMPGWYEPQKQEVSMGTNAEIKAALDQLFATPIEDSTMVSNTV